MSEPVDSPLSAEEFDVRVIAKVELILRAIKVSPHTEFQAAWPDEQIRARAVRDRLGVEYVEGRSAEYIEARFDSLAEGPQDPVHAILASRFIGRQH